MTDNTKSSFVYLLAGTRQGWDFSGCTRHDESDGYSVFQKPNGDCHAVVLTTLLLDAAVHDGRVI